MSNRRRLHPPPLPLAAAQAMVEAAACPDCDSEVVLDRASRRVRVEHDDGCPTLAALRRQGRTFQLAVARTAGQSEADYAEAVAKVTAEAARVRDDLWPDSAGLRLSLGHGYTDLDLSGGS